MNILFYIGYKVCYNSLYYTYYCGKYIIFGSENSELYDKLNEILINQRFIMQNINNTKSINLSNNN